MDPQYSHLNPQDPYAVLPSVTRQGKFLRLPRNGFPLPTDRCYKCNAPATVTKRKNLAWHHPSVYLAILLNILIYIILAICLQKRAAVQFGLCSRCNNRRTLWICIWTFVLMGSVPLFTLAITREDGLWAVLGVFALFGGAIAAALVARLGTPKRIDDFEILLAGSGQAFRDTFPEA